MGFRQRIAGPGLEAGCDALAIVITKGAENRPANAGGVHGPAGVVKLLAKIRIHAADRIGRHANLQTLGGRRVLPAEIPAGIALDGLALVDVPQILIDLLRRR